MPTCGGGTASTCPGWWPHRGWPARGRSPPAPGIAGGATPRGDYRITVCYLDGDPAETAEALQPLIEEAWRDAPVLPMFAAPFASLVPCVWPADPYQSYD